MSGTGTTEGSKLHWMFKQRKTFGEALTALEHFPYLQVKFYITVQLIPSAKTSLLLAIICSRFCTLTFLYLHLPG